MATEASYPLPPQPSTSTASSSAHPLRPYYVSPSPEDFLAVPASSSRHATYSKPGPSSSYSSLNDAFLSDATVTVGPSSLSGSSSGDFSSRFSASLQAFASNALLGYASTACVMPFEVGKTLMQVQWIPKADVELLNEEEERFLQEAEEAANAEREDPGLAGISEEDDDSEDGSHRSGHYASRDSSRTRRRPRARKFRTRRGIYDEDVDIQGGISTNHSREPHPDTFEDEEEVQSYFSDLRASSSSLRPPAGPPALSVTGVGDRDGQGYILRRSIFEVETKPDWILPFTVTGGVMDMMKGMGRWKAEGWLSLWKGQWTTFVSEMMSSAIQPFFYSVLTSTFLSNSPFSSLPLVHNPYPGQPLLLAVSSHVITSVLLSPLDLIRTRLIVQSSQGRYKKYSGPMDAFTKINEEEGGILSTCYTHSNLLFPTLLDSTFRTLFHLGIPLFIERRLLLGRETHSILFLLAEFVLSTASLLVTLPIETVRRRLQIQSRANVQRAEGRKTYKARVETRPTPYIGILEASWRILTEETGRLHLHNVEQKPRLRRPSFNSATSRRPTSAGNTQASPTPAQTPFFERAPPAPSHVRELSEQEEREERQGKMPLLAGISQLYRGFSMGLGANLIVLLLGLVAGREDRVTGWAEM